MHNPEIRPRTLAPPPLVYAVALYAAWWLNQRYALSFDLEPVAHIIGWALIGLGLAGFIWALAAIWGQRTTVNPYKGASNLVTHGPFARSRNPIYVSDWFIYLGVTLLLGTAWPLLFVPLVWTVMRYGVIAHEEAHLLAKFGDEYRTYCSRVKRWL
ncbi:MAG: isoprenylcysteine carboxylmethyltransferase family protein [Pseudomonadota bacterium]|nr:isoprenylcysteine carboxylmethyltransferase family protein [Pseudomonadota bacterium]